MKQEFADVLRSHRLDVHQNAYESQGEQIYKTSARCSVEKLSIKSILNVHTVLASLPGTMLREASPAPQQTTVPKLMWSMSLKTPPSSPRAKGSELQKAARPLQSFRSKSRGTTIVTDDSASQAERLPLVDIRRKGCSGDDPIFGACCPRIR